MLAGPAGGDPKQGDGVAAAGEGEGQGAGAVRLKPGGQPVADAVSPGRREPVRNGRAQPALRGAGQAKRVRISAARVRRAALPAAA